MPSITLNKRSSQSSPLSIAQVDANWSALEAAIATLGTGNGSVSSVTLAKDSNATNILTIANPTITTSGVITLGFQSQSTNRFFASPNGISGVPEFRLLAAEDLPTVPINKGGTNSTTALNNNRVMVSSGGAIVESSTIDTTELGYLNGIGALSAGFIKKSGSALTSSSTVNLTSEATGILPQANGGTGVSGSSANGQLLIGNGTGFALGTITAGSGISITNGSGSITISNTGLPSLNGLTGAVSITTGNIGTDFNVSTSGSNVVLNMPSSSATNRGLLTSTDWSTFNAKEPALTKGNLTESTSSVLTITGGSGAVIGSGTSIQVKQASGSSAGYLSSSDWTTFNNKQPAGSYITGIIVDSPLSGAGTSSSHLSMSAATSSTSGYLTSTDWSTFNNKGNGTVTSVTATSPVVSTGGVTPVISIPAATTSTNGYLSSTDWNTFNSKGSGTVTSVTGSGSVNGMTLTGTITNSGSLTLGGTLGNISNSQLTNSSITINGTSVSLGGSISVGAVASVTGTSPIISSGGANPAISIPAATSSTNGYLSSSDWSTFNAKEPSLSKGNLTEATSSVLTITGGTNSVIGSGTSIQVKQATSSQSGYLSSSDWSNFNSKIGTSFATNTTTSGYSIPDFTYSVWYSLYDIILPTISLSDIGKVMFIKNINNSFGINVDAASGAAIDNMASVGLSHGTHNQAAILVQATSTTTWSILSHTGTIS